MSDPGAQVGAEVEGVGGVFDHVAYAGPSIRDDITMDGVLAGRVDGWGRLRER